MKKAIKKLIEYNCSTLENSARDFKSIYEIIFSMRDCCLCESTDGYRINRLSYGDADKIIRNIAYSINEKLKVKGEYIAIDFVNCAEWIITFWAVLMSGNKPYLVNGKYPISLINGCLKTLNIRYTISLHSPTYETDFVDYNLLLTSGHDDYYGDFENSIALSTSATSLNEVICVYSGAQIAGQILNTKYILTQNKQITKFYLGELKQLAFLPFYHIFGLSAVYFWFAFFGRTFVFLKDYSGDTILKTCRKHNITHLFAVPVLWHTIETQLKNEIHKKGEKTEKKFIRALALSTKIQNLSPAVGVRFAHFALRDINSRLFGKSMKFMINGGGYIKDSSLYMFNALGYPLHVGFGTTEIGITSVELGARPKARNNNSVGKPFPSIEYKIDPDGILCVRGTSVCDSIITNGVEEAVDGWYSTGDLAYVDENGNYFINGRKKDVIIGENGENINPDLIEKQFSPGQVNRFCVFGYKRGVDEYPALALQISRHTTPHAINKIYNTVVEQNDALPMAMRVREIYFTYDNISSELAIKVSRQYLLRGIENGEIKLIPCGDLLQNNSDDTFDENCLMVKTLKKIFADELNTDIEKIGVDMHIIFDLGGSSFEYFSILSAINSKFNVAIKIDEGSSPCTIREFVSILEEKV